MNPVRARKRPIEIEAIQYAWHPEFVDELIRWGVEVEPTPHWFGACGEDGHDENTDLLIVTLEGKMLVRPANAISGFPGDWIIRGVAGEFYPCKPDIFERTYELVP